MRMTEFAVEERTYREEGWPASLHLQEEPPCEGLDGA